MKNGLLKSIAILAGRIYGFFATLPFLFLKNKVSPPQRVSHSKWVSYLEENFNKEGMRVLEIGSRNVTGANWRSKFSKATYVGFDLYEGENVDIVGDAHKLSTYFAGQERFDLIFSSAVFEHLYMPWVVATEIQKLLKVGGCVFIETHFTYSAHNMPWDFFRFSDKGLRALFNDALGFDLMDSGMCNPISAYFAHRAEGNLKHTPVIELYCHSEILCRKRCEIDSFDWNKLTADDVVDGTRYPPPE